MNESPFEIGKDPWQIRVWWKSYKKYHWNCIVPTFKFGHSSMMVWVAFGGFNKPSLVIIPSNERLAIDFVTIVYKRTLNGFNFLHHDSEQLILIEYNTLIHHSSLPSQCRCIHSIES